MSDGSKGLPGRVVERLVSYRRHLRRLAADGQSRIYSHDLGRLEGGRLPLRFGRDLMTIGYGGSPAKGYDVDGVDRSHLRVAGDWPG